jgi:hypothetical protein
LVSNLSEIVRYKTKDNIYKSLPGLFLGFKLAQRYMIVEVIGRAEPGSVCGIRELNAHGDPCAVPLCPIGQERGGCVYVPLILPALVVFLINRSCVQGEDVLRQVLWGCRLSRNRDMRVP